MPPSVGIKSSPLIAFMRRINHVCLGWFTGTVKHVRLSKFHLNSCRTSVTSADTKPHHSAINTLRPRQNVRRFADDTFERIFSNENVRISIKISLRFVPKGQINNIPALVQIMGWRRSGDKPLSEPMMVSLLTHIYVTRPQWAKSELMLIPYCVLYRKRPSW